MSNTTSAPLMVRLASYLQITKLDLPSDPATIVEQARRAPQPLSHHMYEELKEPLTALIYGSNKIETAGSSFEITRELCHNALCRHPQNVAVEIDERDPSYHEHIQALVDTRRKADQSSITRSRREIIFHIKALKFMIDRIVLQNEAWSEELILQAHGILYEGLDEDILAGQYRDHEVAVAYNKPGEKLKKSVCMRAKAVPGYMKKMITDLNKEITECEATGQIDPYSLAARYHHQFVMIHPFGDGNGRMTRIILNVLLLKYAGHVAPFGSDNDEKEKQEYLDVVGRGRKIFDQEDMEVSFQEQISHHEFAQFVLSKSRPELERLWNRASAT